MKRAVDLICVLVGLAILWPLILAVGLAVRLLIGRPVFFRQQRPGLGGRPFLVLKFRTMKCACDSHGNLLPDAERLTPFGRWLRATSLDELPELLNVLKGDMSLVGPRPLLMKYLPYFTEQERIRFSVRPGITGWAQINGRNRASWDQRLRLDVWYVQNRSFWLDLKIVMITAWLVLHQADIEVAPRTAMLDFDEVRRNNEPRHRDSFS